MKNKIFIYLLLLIILIGLSTAVKAVFYPYKYQLLPSTEFIKQSKETKEAVILDVRTPEEYNESHIDNSINIDFRNTNFISKINKLDKTKPYFVYCRSGNRSADAIEVMKDNGFKDLAELKDGVVSNSSLLTSDNMSDTEKEKAGLIYMREEEKLARDVYVTLYKKWNLNQFSNISSSEQKHMDLVKSLLDSMGIQDPVSDDTVGVFKNQDLQKLYTELIKKGYNSAEDALSVGILIEELDIYDLERYKLETKNQEILQVYDILIDGSKNHLRAFNSQLSSRGIKYEPKYLSKEKYEEIVSTQGQGQRGRGR